MNAEATLRYALPYKYFTSVATAWSEAISIEPAAQSHSVLVTSLNDAVSIVSIVNRC